VTLSGETEPLAQVTVFEGAAAVASTTASPSGAWSVTLTGVSPGEHIYTAVARDAAGNPSQASGARTVTVAQTSSQTPTSTPTPSPTPAPTVTPAQQPLPPPEQNETVNVTEPEGKVLIKIPGTNKFVELKADQQVPVGSTIDTTKGAVTLTSIGTDGKPQSAVFSEGIFKVTQTKGAKPITVLTLVEPLSCPKGAKAAAGKKTRKLWGEGKGNFRTTGRLSSATVRGTKWLVQDTCDTTLTQVKQGSVAVKDFVTGKTVLLKAGKKYIARARRR
jgi:hypothetical protein